MVLLSLAQFFAYLTCRVVVQAKSITMKPPEVYRAKTMVTADVLILSAAGCGQCATASSALFKLAET